jgi:hypothetical protein
MQTKSGKAEFKASLNIDLKTKVASNVNLTGGTLKIKGKSGATTGIVTGKTHQDYITGAYLKKSQTVTATA